MLTLFIIFFQRIGDHFQVSFVSQKISIGRINKQGFDIMLFDIISIGLLYVKQVLVRDILFVGTVSFF